MAGVQVDGADVPAVCAAAREAVARARAGEGPTLIEGLIKRINSHTSEDNQARYRTAEEIAEALAYDPVVKFENWLAERGWLSTAEAERIRLELEREAGEAADWAEQQPDPRPEDTSRNVYSES
jgi:TPP-dependent pyruvate/acetoin dehydrogenase alpha subunit